MTRESPLRGRHEAGSPAPRRAADAAHRPGAATGVRVEPPRVRWVPWGPGPESAVEIVAAFGDPEAEYAAIRGGAGLIDAAQRGTLLVTGADRRGFLDRMLTQDLKDLVPWTARESFWLTRQGRIEADLLLVETGDRILADLDVHAAASCAAGLGGYIFGEDVSVADATGSFHRLAIHGPGAIDLCARAAGGAPIEIGDLRARSCDIAGASVVVARRDQAGVPGLELFVPREAALGAWDALLDAAAAPDVRRARPAGWFAYNTARIEGGTPLFNVDFGPGNLPHETGVLERRVSFRKGCYLGQEIVARMQNLGRPKQMLVGLRPAADVLPVAGAPVYAGAGGAAGEQVGVVTSSTISPMLGASPVAFAMVRAAAAEPGAAVMVGAEGSVVEAAVAGLAFHAGEG
jgi:folate-binding protein YgfZ